MTLYENFKIVSSESLIFRPNLRDSVLSFLKKGQRVMVNGRLSYGEMKDESGKPKSATSIIADEVIFFQQP